jgi:hypothetical protein
MKTKTEILALIDNAIDAHNAVRQEGIITAQEGDIHCETRAVFELLNEGRKVEADFGGIDNRIFIYGKDSKGRKLTYLPN